jgi:hypothetical protein
VSHVGARRQRVVRLSPGSRWRISVAA